MKPSIPQGCRDFSSNIIKRRSYIIQTIRNVFELYGFEPLETPAFEHLETLMGKYGDEGDKLIFKILNNGLDLPMKKEAARKDFENILDGKNEKGITERALRYDLTIPFARYVAMNYGKLTIPYKRYQIQPVWRADRPQKGRYREFFQCDADVAGTYSLTSDAEFAILYSEVFKQLKIETEIKINNRKILYALAEICGSLNLMNEITATLDKLDKIGIEKVMEALALLGLNNENLSIIKRFINIEGTNEEKLTHISAIIAGSETGIQGIEELRTLLGYTNSGAGNKNIKIDFTLARGLNYYTGTIYEVKATNVKIGSIGGGGRYDNLTGLFGIPNVPGVGISFGLDRIYDVMEELGLFPDSVLSNTKALFFNLGKEESRYAFDLMQLSRSNGISCEMYYESTKLEKQFKYATKKNIPFAIIIGSKEMAGQSCVVKNLKSGEQKTINAEALVAYLKNA